jgi:hypothetical protein
MSSVVFVEVSALIAEMRDMPGGRAERIVKSSPEGESCIRQMCSARPTANELKLKLAWIRMRHSDGRGG